MTKKLIYIEGMHCMHCATTVEKAVKELAGVKDAKINLDKNLCTAKLSGEVTDENIKDAIKNAGFEVTDIQTKNCLF